MPTTCSFSVSTLWLSSLHLLSKLVQAKRGLVGIMNFTNPGAISHNEVLELYKQYVDKDFAWSNFTIEEQAKVIKAPRSNNLLDTSRVRQPTDAVASDVCSTVLQTCSLTHQCGAQMESEFPQMLGIKESLIKYVFEPNSAKVWHREPCCSCSMPRICSAYVPCRPRR